MIMVSSTHVGNNLGPRQLRRFRKRRDFGAAAGIDVDSPLRQVGWQCQVGRATLGATGR